MKEIQESTNEQHWPRKRVPSVECRKRDLVIRISDWTHDRDEPAYDVEVYIGGVYDWNESESFTLRHYMDESPALTRAAAKCKAKQAAIQYAQQQTQKLL